MGKKATHARYSLTVSNNKYVMLSDNKSEHIMMFAFYENEIHFTSRLKGNLHASSGMPSNYILSLAGAPLVEEWHEKNIFHRVGKPARRHQTQEGVLLSESWMIKGIYHCETGPALIQYMHDGRPLKQQWVIKGGLHRTDGPASINYHYSDIFIPDGEEPLRVLKAVKKEWFINGKSVDRGDGICSEEVDENDNVIKTTAVREGWSVSR